MDKILWLLDNVNRIGHIFMEPYFIRNLFDNSEQRCTILIPASKSIANVAALKIIHRYFRIEVCEDMNLFSTLFNNVRSNDVQFRDFIVKKWRSRLWLDYLKRCADSNDFKPKRFSLTYDEIRTGLALQERLGIPSDAEIVVLHNREGGYLRKLTYHSYRDAHVENFIPAIEHLTRRGYWVVRIGDATMVPLPKMPQVLDLPFLPERTDFMDIWFSATCTFFIGNTSGPVLIPFGFGRPRLLVNYIPGDVCLPGHAHDLYIPKLLYSRCLNRYLTLKESVEIISYRTEDYEKRNVDVCENTSGDILDAVQEMLNRIDSRPYITDEMHTLQRQYRYDMKELDQKLADSGRHNIINYDLTEIGNKFLKKYPHLFATDQSSL